MVAGSTVLAMVWSGLSADLVHASSGSTISAGSTAGYVAAASSVAGTSTDCLGLSIPVAPAAVPEPAGEYDGIELSSGQVTTARTIVQVGDELKISRRGVRIAIAVAMQESSLNPAAVNGPYIGLFQQKDDPSSGLYTGGDRRDPAAATRMFFQQLVKRVPGYDLDPRADWQIGEVVQETKVGRNVLQWFDLSTALNDKLNPAPVVPRAPAAVPVAVPVPAGWLVGRTGLALRAHGLALAAPDPAATGTSSTDGTATSEAVVGGSQSAADSSTSGAAATNTGSAADSAASSEPSGTPADSGGSVATTSPSTPPGTDASVDETSTAATTPATTGTTTVQVPSTTGDPAGTTSPDTTPLTTTPPATTPPATTGVPTTGTTSSPPTAPSTLTAKTPTGKLSTTTTSATDTPSAGTSSGTKAPTTTTPSTTTASSTTTPPRPREPAVVDTPDVPVPTGTDDDPGLSGGAPAATQGGPAVLDCSPDAGGRSTVFDPGMIISDAVFYNATAMTAAEIRSFLNRAGAACTSQECLRNVRLTTPDIPQDQYCRAYQGGIDEDFATVLAKLSTACWINPQVMLVTLQKESALVTRTDVTADFYAAAFGWHCPDTGPGGSANCDPAYAGLFNQTAGMAKQWSRYRVDPGKYNYRAGQTANILWNVPESGCGGSDVYIRNTATASLYNYTPYQPDDAALAAYPGVGDKCSTYGNRNFFMLFQKWFGVTGGGASAQIAVNGVNVTIPSGPHVAAGAAGKVIKAPNAAVAGGLAAGFAAIGLPYVYGGGTAGGGADQGCARAGGASNSCQGIVGFDCSGLTGYVLARSGFAIPDYSGAQRAGGTDIPWSQGQPGDIIGYDGHVAIYLGLIDGVPYLLEAPTVGMYVQVRPVYRTNNGVPVDGMLHRYWS